MRRRIDPGLSLLLTPLLWGATFPATKIALRHMAVLPVMAWSRTLGLLTIAAFTPWLLRGRSTGSGWAQTLGPGAFLGGLMFLGYLLQTEGLARTTATNAAFITVLYVVFTPVIAAAALRQRVPRAAWFSIPLSLVGLALLSVRGVQGIRPHAGDLLVLAGAVLWAGHIVAAGHFSSRMPPVMLSLWQMAWAAGLHLLVAIPSGLDIRTAASTSVWPLLIVTGVVGSGVAFTIQLLAQRTLKAARAVILLAGEAVFAAAFSAVWIGERLAATQWGGAVLVLAAIVWSERSARRGVDRATAPSLDPAAVP